VRRKGATSAELETLYRERFEHFARVASAICGDRDRGRDAVQAAFTTAMRERRSFRGSGRIAREPHDAPLETTREIATNGKAEDSLGLSAWIAALPERQREALFLRYYADLEYSAIAEVLGIEVGTVSATLSAAHQTLRKKLEEVRR
jgi:DNA-directed RNA polymerase specialized sigma24 family protein